VINVQPGYINTNISINALSSDGSKNNTNDDDHRNGYQPEYVARVISDSILNRDKEVIVAILLHKFAIWLRFFFPNLFFWAMKIRAKTSEEKKYQ
jgi:dehydrogenase/reductase SDR family protein 7B